MKRILAYSILASLMLFASCRKSDNPKLPALTRVPVPNLIKDPTGNQAISALSPAASAAFSGKFSVNLKFPDDVKPSKMDVVVRKNNNNTNVKVFQANITTWPTTVVVSGATLISMFGPIVLGDAFEFGVDIYTQDGQKFEAFPVTGTAYGSGVAGEYGGVNPTVTYSAICPYDPTIYVGNFTAVDAFGDADGATIVLTNINATQFSFKYPSILNCIPIVVTVNALSNTATIAPNQILGTHWDPAYLYPNTATYANPGIISSTGGIVAPCDKTFTILIQWGTANNTLTFGGPYSLKLTKQ